MVRRPFRRIHRRRDDRAVVPPDGDGRPAGHRVTRRGLPGVVRCAVRRDVGSGRRFPHRRRAHPLVVVRSGRPDVDPDEHRHRCLRTRLPR
ncbi:hypothetical protein KTR9_0433 [Gordonia sp. KTR9]|nr:hypothetical protein KTR9_0433 [Gordonia sp. KTR9]